jgi:hypothetical protein
MVKNMVSLDLRLQALDGHIIFLLPGVEDGLTGLYYEIEVVYRDRDGKSISSR